MLVSLRFVISFCCFIGMANALKSGRSDAYIQVSKIECDCLNRSLCSVGVCRLRPIRRNVAQITVNVSLHQRPITNCKLNIDMYRKYTTYNSFPINITVDACDFIKNTERIPIVHTIYNMLANKTNLIHLCPYNELYVYVENITASLPPYFGFMPSGNYLGKTKWSIDGVVWFIFNIWLDWVNPQNTFLS